MLHSSLLLPPPPLPTSPPPHHHHQQQQFHDWVWSADHLTSFPPYILVVYRCLSLYEGSSNPLSDIFRPFSPSVCLFLFCLKQQLIRWCWNDSQILVMCLYHFNNLFLMTSFSSRHLSFLIVSSTASFVIWSMQEMPRMVVYPLISNAWIIYCSSAVNVYGLQAY